MKLFLARPRGFCAGVERAIGTVKRALEKFGPPIYVRHEIVHNRHVVEELRKIGAVFVEDLRDVPVGSRVIFSAHGVPPSVHEEAAARGLFVIDATCGLVTKVHSAARRFSEKGYHIILIGHRTHVETIGTAGEAPHVTTIVENVEDVHRLHIPTSQKVAYLTQTTLSLDDVQEIVAALKEKIPHVETMATSSICYATTNRQMAVRHIAETVQLIFVVGDPKSSNSNRLREVAAHRGVPSYLVNAPDEIQAHWLHRIDSIGMTAGASTPESVVQECVTRLKQLGVSDVEEVLFVQENVFFQLPKQVLSAE